MNRGLELPLASDIVVSVGRAGYDRRLTDKILSAYTHAYAANEIAVAGLLRQALEFAERAGGAPDGAERRVPQALVQAEHWADFVEARRVFNGIVAQGVSDGEELERARRAMLEAYRRWSDG